MTEQHSLIMSHQPCPDCKSSDALSVYSDGTFCFSCQKATKDIIEVPSKKPTKKSIESFNKDNLVVSSIPDRKISESTCRFYGVHQSQGGTYQYYSYYTPENKEISIKRRKVSDKSFKIQGDHTKATLFGQQLFPKGGRYILITEGELDALAAYQMLEGKTPCVSVKNGVSSLQNIKDQYEYIDSYENILLCFDNDSVGLDFTKEVGELFAYHKVKTMHLSKGKDACDYLKNNLTADFKTAFWRAEHLRVEDVVLGSSLMDSVLNFEEVESLSFPWEGLNKMTYGIRFGELWTLCAGSGVGKTTLTKEILIHMWKTSKESFGLFFLEEPNNDTCRDLLSTYTSIPLKFPDVSKKVSKEDMQKAYKDLFGVNEDTRFILYDHFGGAPIDTIIAKMRYMNKCFGVRMFMLDHISILVSEGDLGGDERKILDSISTKLKKLTIELNCIIIMISHLTRNTQKPHEEGGQTSLKDLRGSGGIGQLSNFALGFERNGQDKDPKKRNITTVRVLKNRKFGLTGPACQLQYDHETGRLEELGVVKFEEIEEYDTTISDDTQRPSEEDVHEDYDI